MADTSLDHDAAYVTSQLKEMSAAQELMGEEWALTATENILSQYERHLRRRVLDVRGTMSEVGVSFGCASTHSCVTGSPH